MSGKNPNEPETTGGKQDGKFKPGQSGNPGGRPKGARHKATLAVEALLDGESEKLTRKAIELAMEGDTVALRLCLERIIPARKDKPVNLSLPKIKGASDTTKAMAAITDAVAEGSITPLEAQVLSATVENFRKSIETADHEERIRKLEEAHNGK